MRLHQLIPKERQVETLDLLGELDLTAHVTDERPYTIVNFVSTADGRAAFHGKSDSLGDDADWEMFHGLREQVDAVMAGTGTLRAEHYGRPIRSPERRARRVEAGRTPEPLMCIVTRSGAVPVQAPLFSDPETHVVVFGPPGTAVGDQAAQVELVPLDPGEMTLTTALRRLRADFGVRSLLCEGGPTLFSALLQERLVDELFLTLAPKLSGGGTAPTIASGPEQPELIPLELAWALEHEGELLLRYRVAP